MTDISDCHFRNTMVAMVACREVLEDLLDFVTDTPLSNEELAAAKDLTILCHDIAVTLQNGLGESEESMVEFVHRTLDAAHVVALAKVSRPK